MTVESEYSNSVGVPEADALQLSSAEQVEEEIIFEASNEKRETSTDNQSGDKHRSESEVKSEKVQKTVDEVGDQDEVGVSSSSTAQEKQLKVSDTHFVTRQQAEMALTTAVKTSNISDRRNSLGGGVNNSEIADDFEDYAEVSDTLGQLPGAIALPQRMTPLYLGSERYKRDSKISLGSEKESTVSFVNIDIEGGMRGPRMSHAVVRPPNECNAQCRRRRNSRQTSKSSLKLLTGLAGSDDREEKPRVTDLGMSVQSSDKQYRIVQEDNERFGRFGFQKNAICGKSQNDDSIKFFGLYPNQFLTSYIFWTFRSSFLAVLLSAAVWFFSVTIIFGFFIYFIGRAKPYCIHVNGEDFGQDKEFWEMYMDAYMLSWTTFSTVGYGLIFPATSTTLVVDSNATNIANATRVLGTVANQNIMNCTGITILCTIESFLGILMASCWGAIFLSKVTRISSFAQVTFSDPLLIRYGSGVQGNDSSDEDSSCFLLSEINLPLPVLEFRVLNRLAGQDQGEIIDAHMNIFASVDECQVVKDAKNGRRRKRKKKPKRRSGRRHSGRRPSVVPRFRRPSFLERAVFSSSKDLTMEEDPSGRFVEKKSFGRVEIESQEHPFFERIWVARHVLDQDSPLLKPEAKELIQMNGGYWPAQLNSAEGVRKSVKFDQLLVSLSGTSNADTNTVYAQKIYDFVDLCVGYCFCNMLFRHPKKGLVADPSLLNDVVEQVGGGGEDLDNRLQGDFFHDVFLL